MSGGVKRKGKRQDLTPIGLTQFVLKGAMSSGVDRKGKTHEPDPKCSFTNRV